MAQSRAKPPSGCNVTYIYLLDSIGSLPWGLKTHTHTHTHTHTLGEVEWACLSAHTQWEVGWFVALYRVATLGPKNTHTHTHTHTRGGGVGLFVSTHTVGGGLVCGTL